MTQIKISALPASTGVDTVNDVLPVVHLGTTQKLTPQGLVNAAFPQVPFTPTGTISSTTVNSAIAELGTEKAATSALPTEMSLVTANAGISTTPQTISAANLKTFTTSSVGVGGGVTEVGFNSPRAYETLINAPVALQSGYYLSVVPLSATLPVASNSLSSSIIPSTIIKAVAYHLSADPMVTVDGLNWGYMKAGSVGSPVIITSQGGAMISGPTISSPICYNFDYSTTKSWTANAPAVFTDALGYSEPIPMFEAVNSMTSLIIGNSSTQYAGVYGATNTVTNFSFPDTQTAAQTFLTSGKKSVRAAVKSNDLQNTPVVYTFRWDAAKLNITDLVTISFNPAGVVSSAITNVYNFATPIPTPSADYGILLFTNNSILTGAITSDIMYINGVQVTPPFAVGTTLSFDSDSKYFYFAGRDRVTSATKNYYTADGITWKTFISPSAGYCNGLFASEAGLIYSSNTPVSGAWSLIKGENTALLGSRPVVLNAGKVGNYNGGLINLSKGSILSDKPFNEVRKLKNTQSGLGEGATTHLSPTTEYTHYNNTGALTAFTVVLPTGSYNGQKITIGFTYNITTLTVSPAPQAQTGTIVASTPGGYTTTIAVSTAPTRTFLYSEALKDWLLM